MEQNCGEWKQKRNFPGTPRNGGVSFSIGTKTYFGTGEDNTFTRRNDLWEYDAANNVWTQKANFGGTARTFAAAFSIGAKGTLATASLGAVF